MTDLILDSLEIKNFRLFKHLEIERLGRVNLIVGKNGVGKTALLEAIYLYTNGGSPIIMAQLLEDRDEGRLQMILGSGDTSAPGVQGTHWLIRHLFEGRPDLRKLYRHASPGEKLVDMSIGPLNSTEELLSVSIEKNKVPCIRVRLKQYMYDEVYPLDEGPQFIEVVQGIECQFVPAQGFQENYEIANLWDNIVLTPREEAVLKALRLIAPKVQRLNLRMSDYSRIPIVTTTELLEPIPLRSLGEGMSRMLGIILALVNAKDGILLIDEIESGLHYSVQPDMWRLVFETAAKLNVQVFATTHSLDCLRAFESAASERDEEESLLISLRRHHDEPEKIVAVLADKSDLESIVRSHIEVR